MLIAVDGYMIGIFWGVVVLLIANNIIRNILDELDRRGK